MLDCEASVCGKLAKVRIIALVFVRVNYDQVFLGGNRNAGCRANARVIRCDCDRNDRTRQSRDARRHNQHGCIRPKGCFQGPGELLDRAPGRGGGLRDDDDITRSGDRGDGLRGRLADHLELMPRRKMLGRRSEQSLSVADSNLKIMGQLVEIDGAPLAFQQSELTYKRDCRQMTQARVFEKQAQKLKMQKLRQLDRELYGAVRRTRLEVSTPGA